MFLSGNILLQLSSERQVNNFNYTMCWLIVIAFTALFLAPRLLISNSDWFALNK